jgi:hypothetical protein
VAIGIANAMKEKFGDKIELDIYKNDSEKAKAYTLLSSTSVFVNDQLVPREITLDKNGMNDFLTGIIGQ